MGRSTWRCTTWLASRQMTPRRSPAPGSVGSSAKTLKATLDDPNIREIERRLALLSGLDTPTDLAGGRPDERSMHVSVRRFLETLARDGPICLFIEDLHWADSALLRLLEHVAEHAQAVPLLLVTQARPELLDTRPRSEERRVGKECRSRWS